MKEACGVFGIYEYKQAARITFFGLYSLQHRGQESAGIAVSDGKKVIVEKGMGLISQVFSEEKIKSLVGFSAIGHNRYSTTGSSLLVNAQPFVFQSDLWSFAVAHNGNLTNTKILRKQFSKEGVNFISNSDSEVIGHLILKAKGRNFEEKLTAGISLLEGAFSLLILAKDKLYAIRDSLGIRPLVLGKFNSSWVVASETCAFATIGARYVRDVHPGEIVSIDKDGLKTIQHNGKEPSAFCIFEYIYFSRPDSFINGQLGYLTRLRAGQRLAIEQPSLTADLVIAVPDSGTSAALGYSQESKIPFLEGLIKNRYLGRTFIQPEQKLRKLGVKLKFNPLPEILAGKRVVLIDDSIVRGTTTAGVVKMLKKFGAKEVHLRIASPPLISPCYLGIDIEKYRELIAHGRTIEQIRKKIGADTLGYLSLDGLKKAIGKVNVGFCTGCFTENYPVAVPCSSSSSFLR